MTPIKLENYKEFIGSQLLTADHVAELLFCSKRTVLRRARTGKIPKPIKLGRTSLWTVSSIYRYIDERSSPNSQWH